MEECKFDTWLSLSKWLSLSDSRVYKYNESAPHAHFSQDGEVDAGLIFSLAEIAKDSQGLDRTELLMAYQSRKVSNFLRCKTPISGSQGGGRRWKKHIEGEMDWGSQWYAMVGCLMRYCVWC